MQSVRLLSRGPNHWKWQGDQASYDALHKWLRKYFPRPELCQDCKSQPPQELANITKIYNRDFNNWKYLCQRCHFKRDKGINIIVGAAKVCSRCGSTSTYLARQRKMGKLKPRWHYDKETGLLICGKCRLHGHRIIVNSRSP